MLYSTSQVHFASLASSPSRDQSNFRSKPIPILLVKLVVVCNLMSYVNSTQIFNDNPLVYDTSSLYRPHLLPPRTKRSSTNEMTTNAGTQNQFIEACQSKVEVITPYYARNSKGKLRTIVNSEKMQQAIQIETCVRSPRTFNQQQVVLNGKGSGCEAQNRNCFCEQKYKWHRLLVMDSSDSELTRGLFMDWFLFPSNCSCRCKFTFNNRIQTNRESHKVSSNS